MREGGVGEIRYVDRVRNKVVSEEDQVVEVKNQVVSKEEGQGYGGVRFDHGGGN